MSTPDHLRVGCKATFEELTRVGASRVEDLRLLREVQASLEARKLAPALVSRLGVECTLREEWRAQRALDALREVGLLTGGLGEGARRALLEACGVRMQADAALMADGLSKRAQPWQLALVAQTSAIAAAVCATATAPLPPTADAADAASWPMAALRAHVLDSPAAELANALALLHATARAIADEAGEGGRAHTPGGVAGPVQRNDCAGPVPAAGRTADGALQLSRAAEAGGMLGGAGGTLGGAGGTPAADPKLSEPQQQQQQQQQPSARDLNSFVRDRLRALRDAERAAAARALQRAARPLIARRRLAVARAARMQARIDTMRARGAGRRLARALAWRWRLILARRGALRLRRAERAAAARQRAAAAALRDALTPRGRREWDASVRLQSAARRRRARRRAAALRDGWPVRRLQAGVRAWAANRERRWRERVRALRAARAARADWEGWRVRSEGLASELRTSLAVRMHVGAEVAAIDAELRREKSRFEAMFKAWEKKMRKAVLARKLPSDWLPQLHPQTGEAFYFNLATGESRREHPSVRQADLIAARERRSGHEQMDARFALIGEYKHGVVEAAEAVRAGCAARVVAMCAQHAEEWLRTRKGATEDSDLAGAAVSRSPAT